MPRYYNPARLRRQAPTKPPTGFREDLPQSVIDLFAGDVPLTSADRDNREPPLCECGAPVCRDSLCARCLDNREGKR